MLFMFCGFILPKNHKMVVFESFLGKQYSDNPRAIYEYMVENCSKYKMYWSVDKKNKNVFANTEINQVQRLSLRWMLVMTRAKFWIYNSRLPACAPKPKETVYLQTWHGTPLKKLAADMETVHMPGANTVKYKRDFLKESGKWDYLISPNLYSTEIFKRAFQFNQTFIESGYPRNDLLFNFNNQSRISGIKKRSNLPIDKKIILYSPTWRENQFYERGRYRFDLQMDLAQMQAEIGDEYIVLLRLHYLVAENLDLDSFDGFVYDFTHHEDIRELFLIADILITDYSSVFFDYANLKRPMIFYVYDIEEYRDKLRGFYFDFEKNAPGPLVKTTEGILAVVKDIEQNGYVPSEITEAFYQKFCYLEDGDASRRVVNVVFE